MAFKLTKISSCTLQSQIFLKVFEECHNRMFEFQQQIKQDIKAVMQGFSGQTENAVMLANQIQNIDPNDKMRGYNFAHGSNGENNAATLQQGLLAVTNAKELC